MFVAIEKLGDNMDITRAS